MDNYLIVNELKKLTQKVDELSRAIKQDED